MTGFLSAIALAWVAAPKQDLRSTPDAASTDTQRVQAQGPDRRPKDLHLPQHTGIGAVLGMSSSGLALRHQFTKRWASQASVYTTFGRSRGIVALGAQAQLVVLHRMHIRLYAALPFRWRLQRVASERSANFGVDATQRVAHQIRIGCGMGAELFLLPQLALSVEAYGVVQRSWVKNRNQRSFEQARGWELFPAPNLGVYVYFR